MSVIRELVTKLSYVMDNSGLVNYKSAIVESTSIINKATKDQTTTSKKATKSVINDKLEALNMQIKYAKQLAEAERKATQALVNEDRKREQSRIASINTQIRYIRQLSDAQAKASAKAQRDSEKEQKSKDRSIQNLGRSANQFGNFSMFASGAVLAPLVGMLAKGAQTLSEFRQNQASLGGLVGSKQGGVDLQKKTEQFAFNTPLKQPEVDRATKMLVAQGVATEDVTAKLQMLGDVAMGNSDVFDRLSNQYVQAMGKGAPQWDELKRFGEAGVPILKEMGLKYNLSQGQLMEMSKNRQITFKMFDDTLKEMTTTGNFKDAMKLQMSELGGLGAQASDSIVLLLRDIAKDFEPLIKGILSSITAVVSVIRSLPSIVRMVPVVVGLLGGIGLLIAGFVAKSIAGTIALGFMLLELKAINAKLTGIGLGMKGGVASKLGGGGIGGFFSRLGSWFTRMLPRLGRLLVKSPQIALVILALTSIVMLLKKWWKIKEDVDASKVSRGSLGYDSNMIGNKWNEFASSNNPYKSKTSDDQTSKQLNAKVDVTLNVPEGISKVDKKAMKDIAKASFNDVLNTWGKDIQYNTTGVR